MDGSDIFIMIFSMLTSALLGGFGMMLIGGKTIFNYMKVKAMRGRGLLIFVKTSFGWKSVVGKKKENTVVWKADKVKYITTIEDVDCLGRYARVDCIFVELKKPTVAIKLKDGSLYPDDFDPEVYNNLLIRAETRPNADGSDDLKKLITVVLVLLVVVIIGLFVVYGKISDIAPQVASAVI